jgi:DNA-binding MarR family transcriptional regulator
VFGIINKIFSRLINLKFLRLNRTLRSEFSGIKNELNEHLQAINENTNEISANYEYVCEIEAKLDRISERLDKMQMFLENNSGFCLENRGKFQVRMLNEKEKQVFLAIYTMEDHDGVTYSEIAEMLSMSEQLAGNYVTSMIQKGVPVIKRYVNGKPRLNLDQEFKTLQAKENILQVSLSEYL